VRAGKHQTFRLGAEDALKRELQQEVLPMRYLPMIAIATCVALVLHALFARRAESHKADASKPLPSQTGAFSLGAMLAVVLVMAAFWITLTPMLTLLAWAFWIGDNDHWFWRASPAVGAVAAALASAPLFRRIVAQDTGRRFYWVQGTYGAAVLAMWGVTWLLQMAHPIKGSDPLQAAKAVVREWDENPEDFTYQDSFNKEVPDYVPDTHTYLVIGPEEPRGRITVQKHLGYWWKPIATHRFPPSAGELARARQWMERGGNDKGVLLILDQIEYDYPNTPAADDAAELRRKLQEMAAARDGLQRIGR
jgi:hypothetical protein